MKKRVTIDDVAQVAGVSRQTVSRAVNDMYGISPKTRAQVILAVNELGYRPNRLARGMASKLTHTVGLVIGDITNPAQAEVVRGLQDVAQENDYKVFLCNSDGRPDVELELLEALAAETVDGIFILGSSLDDTLLKSFADSFQPIVLIHRYIEHPHIASLLTDIERGVQTVVEYLIGCGHESIGLLSRPGPLDRIRHVRGFYQALERDAHSQKSSLIRQAEATPEGGYLAAWRLFSEHPYVTALVAYNDLMAIGAMRACTELGRVVPADCAIIGFDDISVASMLTPTLSTVRFSKYELGKQATRRLMEMIAAPELIFPKKIIDLELVIRESTDSRVV